MVAAPFVILFFKIYFLFFVRCLRDPGCDTHKQTFTLVSKSHILSIRILV